jgi:branched-chain amino acid transport system substrate-binding protein
MMMIAKPMRTVLRATRRAAAAGAVAALVAATVPAFAQDKVTLSVVLEFTGAGTPLADHFWKGAQLARDEINAAGGILGRKIDLPYYDTQSDPPTSVAAVKRALATDKPYVVLGPIYSGSTIINMMETQAAKTPHLVASEAYTITGKNNPYIFQTSENNKVDGVKMLRWLVEEKKLKHVALIYRTDEWGVSSKDAMLEYFKEKGVKVDPILAVEVKQKDYTAELTKVRAANPEALIENVEAGTAAIVARQFNKLGLKMIHYGQNVCDPVFLELAQGEGDGTYCHTGFIPTSPDPAAKAFTSAFSKRWGKDPSEEAYKGYSAVYMVKIITEKIGSFDREKFAQTLRGFRVTSDLDPHLMSAYWDENGNFNFTSHIAMVKNNKYDIIGRVKPMKGPDSK